MSRLFWGCFRLLIALTFMAGDERIFAAALSKTNSSKTIKVFLLAGQSNMEGADAYANRIDDYPVFKGAGAPQSDVLFASLPTEDSRVPALWRTLAPGESFGSEITFARKLKRSGAAPLAIIKSAIGGTTVAFDWNPAAPTNGQKLYPRTLKLVRETLQELDRRGMRYQLEGVLWHQGENDMLDPKLNRQYARGLTDLIARLRQDLQSPHLRWFIAEVSEKGIWGMDHRRNLAILRQQQDAVLKADPLLRWVPTSHLAFDVMDSGQPHYHFGTQGQLQLGEAFADAYLATVGIPVASETDRVKSNPPVLRKKSRVRLFVLAGQRNMEGEDAFVAQIPQTPGFENLTQPQKEILFRYSLGGGTQSSQNWEALGPVDRLGNFGPELSFGAYLRRTLHTEDTIAVVKFTHSGAQGPDWSPDGSPEAHRNLYPKFSTFVREALEDLARRGHECTLEGVFWHTGESDTYFTPYRQNYAVWMQRCISQVRRDFKTPNLPWFISEQHPAAIWKNSDEINGALRAMAQSETGVIMVTTSQLPHQRTHFGTKGTLLLGEEFAKAYWKQLRADRP
jgi:hypothetical protein